MITFIDLFCGIGGFHRAFKKAGASVYLLTIMIENRALFI